MQQRMLIALALVVGCTHNHAVFIPSDPSDLTRAPGIPAPQLDAFTGDAAASHWSAVVTDTLAVLRDARFRDRLTGFRDLDARVGTSTTGRAVAAFLLGDAASPNQVKTQYVQTRDDPSCTRQTASTGIVATRTGPKFARTVLNPCTLERARTPKTAAYACAINTAAHEMTHAVLGTRIQQLYLDAAHADATEPLVSYTVGAIAQCLYLEQQGVLTASMFASCVNQVGTTSFNPATCEQGWLLTLRGIDSDVHAP